MNLNGRAARRYGPPGLPADKADSGVVRKKGVPTVKPARPGGQVPATSRPPAGESPGRAGRKFLYAHTRFDVF
jgi:hypothetical protein